uniref:BTB/POZ domain-containing protein n=1 Tax=Noccaea caerulescens TaxID=107243 RepID=A0A1J3JLT4_NOCCA
MFQRCQHRDLSSQRGLEGSTVSTRFSISSSFLLLDLSLRSYPHLQKNMDQDPLHIAGGVHVPSMYRASADYRSTCSHFGCKIGVAVNSPYCCPAHMIQFPDDNTFALRYIGGFVDGTDLRRSCMVGIYNKCRGYQIGVPTLPRGTIFSSLPWNQPNIFRTDIVGDMAYLFFTDPPHVYPTIVNTGLKWDLKNREEISFPGDQVVFATPLNLKNGGDIITDPVVLHTYKLWSMYLFERGGYHLYCLVRSSVANQKKRKKLEPALLSIASNKKPSKVTSAAKPSKKSKKTSAAATSSAATSVQVVSSLDHFSSQCSQFSKVKEAGSFLASRLTCLGSEPISAYESSLFCETFHMDQSGWRECYLCSKRLHCGCIASKLMVEFMDYGGIGCTHCVNCNQPNLNKRGENPNLFSRLPMKTLGDRPHMNGESEGGGRSSEADLFSLSLRCDTQPLVPGGDKREDFMPHRGFGHLLKSEMLFSCGHLLDAVLMWCMKAEESHGWEVIDELLNYSNPEILFKERLQSLDDLLPHVRFSLLPYELLEKLENSNLSRQIPVFNRLVKEAASFLASRLTCPGNESMFQHRRSSFKELQYIRDGDSNGVLHYVGTSYGGHQWVNPVLAKKIIITSSSPTSRFTDPKALASKTYVGTSFAGPRMEDGHISSWWMVDLGEDHQLMCNYYTFKTRRVKSIRKVLEVSGIHGW